jgi:hypothetical protein
VGTRVDERVARLMVTATRAAPDLATSSTQGEVGPETTRAPVTFTR